MVTTKQKLAQRNYADGKQLKQNMDRPVNANEEFLFRLEQRLKHFADILIALHAFKLYIVIVMSHEFNYILAQSIDVIGI